MSYFSNVSDTLFCKKSPVDKFWVMGDYAHKTTDRQTLRLIDSISLGADTVKISALGLKQSVSYLRSAMGHTALILHKGDTESHNM